MRPRNGTRGSRSRRSTGSRGTRTSSAAGACTPASTTASRTRPRSTRSPPTSQRRAWARSGRRGGCATGASPASATGARRSRSCTAPACGDVPVPEKDLPVVLPEDCVPDGTGNPLAKRADFVDCACPRCGKPARRETDTMDTFVDSSWYYMRYACPDAPTMVDARNDYWNPMDQYIGGIEHAILHLLYARFWTKVMRDLGLVRFDEPFTRLMTQGMLLNHIFFRRTEKGGIDYFAPERRRRRADAEGRIVGAKAKADGAARRVRRHRDDVEEQEERRRSAAADREVRRRHGPAVRDVRRPARGHRAVVGHRRRRRPPLPAPPMDVRARERRRRPRGCRRRQLARRGRFREGGAAGDPRHAEAGELRLRADPVQHGRVGRR